LVRGVGCRVWGLGFRVKGLRFIFQGSGFRFQGTGSEFQGFRIQGSGFRVQRPTPASAHEPLEKKEIQQKRWGFHAPLWREGLELLV